ncbi:DNA-processing protein DprA [Streptomyces abikoensis]|uniref:DNA-processing protein DprA n=1 Tax=Streptomyces abikoensis TaxID=97398 RepID=A0ABW7T7F0_9ACTN
MHEHTDPYRAERAARIALTEAMGDHRLSVAPGGRATDVLEIAPTLIREGAPGAEELRRAMDYKGERALAEGEETGARYIIPTDPEWPATLRAAGLLAPLGLWIKGTPSLAEATEHAIALVGPGRGTDYGRHCAAYLARSLAVFGHNTIAASIGVGGIGDRALAVCAANRDRTPIGVTAGGFPIGDTEASRRHGNLLEKGGLLVSMYRPGSLPDKPRRLDRERLIGCLGQAVTVIEGKGRKWETAALIAELTGRPLLAVPGPIISDLSSLPNILIRDGRARAVHSASGVIARTYTRH